MNDPRSEPDPTAGDPGDFPEIPGYDLIDAVGAGGMGVVYEAIQRSTGRRVAVKVMLESAMASPAAAQRFEREVEFIARLNHPDIVAVLDSGAADGRRFCVMDFIEGVPLDEALTPGECDPDEALALIERVARAVDYAHQRGVLHRDLKPSNILIDDQHNPRLLDFGLAKAIDPVSSLGGRRTISEQGQLIGTVAYMAPEQARGEVHQLSVRTDVYALGAIAYELLTGALPVDISGSLGEALNRLESRDARRPSSLRKILGADTDAILGKALEKNPDSRYETAGALAADIRRSLDGFPIKARRIGPAERFGRWVKRNPRISRIVGLALLVILIVSIVSTYRVIDNRNWRLESQRQWSRMFEALDPNAAGSTDVTLRDLFVRETARLDADPPTDRRVEFDLRQRLGHSLLSVKAYPEAEAQLRLALALQEQTGVGGKKALASILHELAASLWWMGDYKEAEPLYRRALEIRESVLGVNHQDTAETMSHLASTLDKLRKTDEAEAMHRRTLETLRRTLGESNEKSIAGEMSLGNFLLKNERFTEAEQPLRDATERIRRLRGDLFEGVAIGLTNLGDCLIGLDRWDEAKAVLTESLTIKQTLYGDQSDAYAWSLYHLARIARHENNPEARAMAHQSWVTLRAALGSNHDKTKKAEALLKELSSRPAIPD
ncbi:MAG: serine/threonine protein kinase [Phycisphaeraceae bacterium]|nr:serine/threonine protein kinase [Phycisphaeraceae bacterium]